MPAPYHKCDLDNALSIDSCGIILSSFKTTELQAKIMDVYP